MIEQDQESSTEQLKRPEPVVWLPVVYLTALLVFALAWSGVSVAHSKRGILTGILTAPLFLICSAGVIGLIMVFVRLLFQDYGPLPNRNGVIAWLVTALAYLAAVGFVAIAP